MRCTISEFRVLESEIKDEGCLIDAIKEIGYQYEVFEEGTTLNNGYSKSRPKAHIVIRRSQLKGSYGDLGFERNKTGFIIHYDNTDYSLHKDKIKLNKIKQLYSKNVLLKELKKRGGYSVASMKEKEDEIKIRVRRY